LQLTLLNNAHAITDDLSTRISSQRSNFLLIFSLMRSWTYKHNIAGRKRYDGSFDTKP